MKLLVNGSTLRGTVRIPGSKSHTIRAMAISALAEGDSVIEGPLISDDTRAARRSYQALGAKTTTKRGAWHVVGTGGNFTTPDDVIDVGNSGTSMRVVMGSAALLREGAAVIKGDRQVHRRPCGPLAEALNALGARAYSTRGAGGYPPFVVGGPLKGGHAKVEAVTSQYVSSLLLNAPLADGDTHLVVPLMNEKPYVDMTLAWLRGQGVEVEASENLDEFTIPGGQCYSPVKRAIPGDFSSGTFFLCGGALHDNEVVCEGLDVGDTQGDKAVLDYLRQMGAKVSVESNGVRVKAGSLTGCEIDLNATPDALPMLAVMGCFAKGTTRLVNVPQARLKETDRISVMAQELAKLGAKVKELEDGLVIEESSLQSGEVNGHDDHRVVMSLAIAGTMISGTTTINGFEAVKVTFPNFMESLQSLGGSVRLPTPRRRSVEF